MFDVKADIKQDTKGLTVKHTLYIDGKKTRNVNVSVFEGKHSSARLLANLDAADKAADTAFAPIIKALISSVNVIDIDAESALLDMNNVKLYKQGKRLKLVVGSRFLSNERAFYVNEPYALTEAVGSVLTLVCEGRDLFEKIVFKMAFHQRISELFRDHKCMNRVIASAFE